MMRWMILALAPLMSGCLMETLTVTAIQGELAAQNAQSATHQLSYAKDEKARIALQQAVNQFSAQKGRYPATIEELAPNYITALPTTADGRAFAYDPQTGKVLHPRAGGEAATAQPAIPPMTATDEQNLYNLSNAIRDYYSANGRIPTGLDQLTPLYISTIPKMSNGQDYSYDTATGGIYHPRELQTQAAPQQYGAAGQPSGTAAGRVGTVTTEHTRRQLQTLRSLE